MLRNQINRNVVRFPVRNNNIGTLFCRKLKLFESRLDVQLVLSQYICHCSATFLRITQNSTNEAYVVVGLGTEVFEQFSKKVVKNITFKKGSCVLPSHT